MGPDMRLSVYMGFQGSSGLTYKATVAPVAEEDYTPQTKSLADFVFGAKLPQFSGTVGMGLNALGLGFVKDFAAKIPLVNTPGKSGLVEVLLRPNFNVTESGSAIEAQAGLGRITFRLAGDGRRGGTYLVNLLVYSSTGGQFTGENSEQWTFSLAVVKAPDSKPLSFVDAMVSEEGSETGTSAGMLDDLVDGNSFIDRKTARGIFEFLALAEIGIRITVGSKSQAIPQDALAQGASLCYKGSESGRFCAKHLEPFGRDLELGGRIIASMQKKNLPSPSDPQCHMICQVLHSILPYDDAFMALEGKFDVTPVKKMSLELAMEVNWEIIKDAFIIKEANLFIGAEEGSPYQFNLGFNIKAVLKTESSDLEFTGEMYYDAPATFGLSLSLMGMVHDVFGWKYLHVGNVHLTGALTPTPPHVDKAGFGGDICLGTKARCKACVGAVVSPGKLGVGTECVASPIDTTQTGSEMQNGGKKCAKTIYARVAFMMSTTLEDNYFYAEIRSDITLKAFMEALEMDASALPSFITDTGLVKPPGSDAIWFSYAAKKKTLTNVCPPIIIPNGIIVRAGMNFFNVFDASLVLEMQWKSGVVGSGMPDRIFIDYRQSAIEFKWKNTVVLALTSVSDHKEGPAFSVDYVSGGTVPTVDITARAVLLGLEAEAAVQFSNTGINLFARGAIFGSTLQATVVVQGEFPKGMLGTVRKHDLSGVQLRAMVRLDTEIFRAIIDGLKDGLTYIKDDAIERIGAAQAVFDGASASLASSRHDLESKKVTRADKEALKRSAATTFQSAENGLNKAKKAVSNVQDDIREAQRDVDRLCTISSSCGWNPVCHGANAACEILRTAAYLALKVAEGALYVPQLALDAAKIALSAAEGAYGLAVETLSLWNGIVSAAQGALLLAEKTADTASFTLEGVKDAVEFGMSMALKVLDWLPTIESIEFEVGLGEGANIRFQVELTLFGNPKTFEVSLSIDSITNLPGAVKDAIMDLIGVRRRSRNERSLVGSSGQCKVCNQIAIKSVMQWLSWLEARHVRIQTAHAGLAKAKHDSNIKQTYELPSRATLVSILGSSKGNAVADQTELITPAELAARVDADPTVLMAKKAAALHVAEFSTLLADEETNWWNAWVSANVTLAAAKQQGVSSECPALACSGGSAVDCLLASAETVQMWARDAEDMANVCESESPFEPADLFASHNASMWAGLGTGCTDASRSFSKLAGKLAPTITAVMGVASRFVHSSLDNTAVLDAQFHKDVASILAGVKQLSKAGPDVCDMTTSDEGGFVSGKQNDSHSDSTTILDVLQDFSFASH